MCATIFLVFSIGLSLGIAEVSVEVQWDYSAVEKSGKFCPEKDSCHFGRSSRGSLELDWRKRNCFCDNDCSIYGDCCIDANAFDPVEQRDHYNSFECRELRQYGAIYMRSKCSEDWTLPKIKKACEDITGNSDPVGSMPVTSKVTGITYKNYYCAVCNQASAEVQFWKPRLECPTLQGYNSRFNNLTKSFLMENLKYNNGQWAVEFNTIGVPVFHTCYFDPFLPEVLEPKIRNCNKDKTISSCPSNFTDNNISELCGSYTGIVYYEDQVFRNSHCAICNNVSTDSLICIKLEGRRIGFPGYFKPLSFAVLFDIDGSDGEQVGITDKCFDGELWDPFAKKCRNVICGEEGQIFINGHCYNEGEVPTTSTTTSTTTTSTTTTASSTTTTTVETTTTTTRSTTTQPTTEVPSKSTSTVNTTVSSSAVDMFEAIESLLNSNPSTSSEHSIVDILFPNDDSAVRFPKEDSTSHPVSSTTSTTQSTSTSTTTSKRTSSTTSVEVVTTERIETTTTTTTKKSTVRITTTVPSSSTPTITEPMNLTEPGSVPFKSCPKFLLSSDEFKLENDSIYVPAYDKTYMEGQFWLTDESAYICRPSDLSSGTLKFSPVMGYVTLACLGVSLVCLVVHLIISCIAPELQNISGKNLFSLSLALVGAYTSFLANMFAIDISELSCFVLAVLMYYFYLAAFFWMLNIGFDVARTLKQATTDLRLTSGAQWGKFFIYTLIGWFLPALIVIAAVVIDVMEFEEIPERFRPGFGGSDLNLCWFSGRTSLLVYFVIPFSIIMSLNLVFFFSSACIVWETTRSSAKITTSGPKINFYLYLRLSTLMGLSWVAGVLAGGLDIEEVWYVFLVLNTLQGLFILVFFSCSKKVVTSVKERLCGDYQDETNSTWQWSGRLKSKDQLDSRESQDSHLSSRSSSYLTGSGVRPFKYSATSYDQYHKYDQRFYSCS